MANIFGQVVSNMGNKIDGIIGTSINGPIDTSLPFISKKTSTKESPTMEGTNAVFIESYKAFSGTDCIPVAVINGNMIVLSNVITVTYSTYRDKIPVRTLGRTMPKGFTASGRTIAGTIVFAVFDKMPLYQLITSIDWKSAPGDRYSSPLSDQIPPFDLMLIYHNEYGAHAIIKLYGVEISQEGQTTSINDVYSENVMQYVCKDMDLMTSYNDIAEFKNLLFEKQLSGQFTDNKLADLMKYRNDILSKISVIDKKISDLKTERSVDVAQNIALFPVTGVTALINNMKNTESYHQQAEYEGFYNSKTRTWNDQGKQIEYETALKNKNKIDRNARWGRDHESQIDTYLNYKGKLINQLNEVNSQISNYQNAINGWNAQNSNGSHVEKTGVSSQHDKTETQGR